MWSVAKSLQIPLDPKIKTLYDTPYTISYVIRKRQQVDNLNELPKEKRPTERLIWEGTAEEIDDWIDKVFGKKPNPDLDMAIIDISEVER